jgi:L-threonylcarbamoyladenylate synthase
LIREIQSNMNTVNHDLVDKAVANLLAGNLVAFPTETVYGLGADACNSRAIARIYKVKGRPADHPLIVHIAGVEKLLEWTYNVPAYATKLAHDFWPGPMTLVLQRSELASDFITGGQNTVGIRVPDHPLALALLTAYGNAGGRGIAAPSANRFGQVSPTDVLAVKDELGTYLSEEDMILDGGVCQVGVESTIIDCTGDLPRVLRPGAISETMINKSTGMIEIFLLQQSASRTDSITLHSASSSNPELIRVSGSLANHYAPSAKVVLSDVSIPGQGLIALESIETPYGVIRLASPHDHEEFARVLYSALRKADTQGLKEVVVIPPTGTGIAVAIRDRLLRAANGR